MHIIIGALLIALLLLGCRVLWYAAICMRPRVQELRAEQQRVRELQRTPRPRSAPISLSAFVLSRCCLSAPPLCWRCCFFRRTKAAEYWAAADSWAAISPALAPPLLPLPPQRDAPR